MEKIGREELKKDFKPLIVLLQKVHRMGPEIERELFIDHAPVIGLCHTRGCFIHFASYYLQYEMDHIIQDVEKKIIARRVTEVIVYDNFIEYEAARVKAMSNVKNNEQTGLNFN